MRISSFSVEEYVIGDDSAYHGAYVTFPMKLRKGTCRVPCSMTVSCDEAGVVSHE